jgi:hypothetical protein
MIWTPEKLAAYYAELQRLKKKLASITQKGDSE